MYEIIEKNKYGVLVRKIKSIPTECEKCKYTGLAVTLQPCKSCKADNSYYLPDSEAEKFESENQLVNTTIDDLYIESKCYFEVKKKLNDTQKELIEYQKKYLFVESNTSLSIDPNKINTSVFQFHQNGNVILEFMANGDIFIKGELVENNIDVVNMLKDICNGKYIQQTDSDTQKELIDLRVELRVEKEKSKALEEYSRGLELNVKELEGTIENNETELIDSQYSSIIGQWMITKCCSFLVKDNFNYCPNCGRKIIRK